MGPAGGEKGTEENIIIFCQRVAHLLRRSTKDNDCLYEGVLLGHNCADVEFKTFAEN